MGLDLWSALLTQMVALVLMTGHIGKCSSYFSKPLTAFHSYLVIFVHPVNLDTTLGLPFQR